MLANIFIACEERGKMGVLLVHSVCILIYFLFNLMKGNKIFFKVHKFSIVAVNKIDIFVSQN